MLFFYFICLLIASASARVEITEDEPDEATDNFRDRHACVVLVIANLMMMPGQNMLMEGTVAQPSALTRRTIKRDAQNIDYDLFMTLVDEYNPMADVNELLAEEVRQMIPYDVFCILNDLPLPDLVTFIYIREHLRRKDEWPLNFFDETKADEAVLSIIKGASATAAEEFYT